MGLAVALVGLVVAAPARAQWALGPWEDGTVVRRGVLRVGFGAQSTNADQRFARRGSSVESLGADFAIDSLGPGVLPLNALRPALATLTGVPNPPLSLGRLQVGIEASSVSTPIAFDFGLTRRITLSALIPYTRTRAGIFPKLSGPEGTLGINPAYLVAGARAQNTTVVAELVAAATTLQVQLTTCVNSTAPSCAAINADRAGATALLSTATSLATAVAGVYGTDNVAGSPYAPVGRTSLQTAVEARLTNADAALRTFLGTPPSGSWIGARPVGAAPIGLTDLQTILSDSLFGIRAAPLEDIEHSHVGDIELGAKAVLVETRTGSTAGEPPPRLAARASIAGIVRLGTGGKASADRVFDLSTGDGQTDVELRGYLDLLAGRRWWTSVIARYAIQMADQLTTRVPAYVGEPFPPVTSKAVVQRDLGDVLELEVAPRFAPNPSFSFSADYRFRSKQADTYSGGTPAGVNSVGLTSALGAGTAQHEQRVGFAMSYSTLRGYAQRRAPWPIEVSFSHTQVIAGTGALPKAFVTALSIRLYHSLVGGDAMRQPPP